MMKRILQLFAAAMLYSSAYGQPVSTSPRAVMQSWPDAGVTNRGQVLTWNGDNWVSSNSVAGGGTAAVAQSTNIVTSTNGAGVVSVALADPTTVSQMSAGNLVATNAFLNLITSTNLPDTNLVAFINTFPSQSNSVTLNNGEWLLQSAGPVSFTNAVGVIAGQRQWSLISVSNSSASTFTNFSTIPNARYIGSSSTNALAIPSGKVGQWIVEAWGTFFTNIFNCVQQ
jgi:hypothetical protein